MHEEMKLVVKRSSLQRIHYHNKFLNYYQAILSLDFTGQRTTSTIAVVIFAIFVGFAYLRVARKQPDNGSLLKRGIDAVYALIMSIVTFVLRLTPYGIIAIMASTIATSDFSAIWTLGKFMIASYAALLTMYVIHLIILAIMGINPIRYVKNT